MSLNHCITKSLIELCSHQAISQPSFIYRYSSEAEYNEEERWLGPWPAVDLDYGDFWSVHHPVAGLGLYPAVPCPANQGRGTVCQPCQTPTHPALHLQDIWNWPASRCYKKLFHRDSANLCQLNGSLLEQAICTWGELPAGEVQIRNTILERIIQHIGCYLWKDC